MENKEILYYYCTQEALLRILKDKTLRFTDLLKSEKGCYLKILFEKHLAQLNKDNEQCKITLLEKFNKAFDIKYKNTSLFGVDLYEKIDFNALPTNNAFVCAIQFNKNELEKFYQAGDAKYNITKIHPINEEDGFFASMVSKFATDNYEVNHAHLFDDTLLGGYDSKISEANPAWRIFFKSDYNSENGIPFVTLKSENDEKHYNIQYNASSYYFDLPLPINAIKEFAINSESNKEIEKQIQTFNEVNGVQIPINNY